MSGAGSGPAARFQVGGAIRKGNLYVPRGADDELPAALLEGEFCYVLAPRQMGKSSLKVRATDRLEERGVRWVDIDLTVMGSDSDSPEDWYIGLLDEIVTQLDLETDLDEFWDRHDRLKPVHRWSRFLREALLEEVAEPVVIFIDEIDSVLALSFSTDDFFAAIRATYNQRAGDLVFGRLTFCLLGVAAPSDLMRDPHRTPFNIGRPIQLADFDAGEARDFLPGLAEVSGEPEALLAAVLAWTDGHPYLTQKLCHQVGQHGDRAAPPMARVRAVVGEVFFRPGAPLDPNLQTAQDRLLRAGAERPGMLALYRRVIAGGDVSLDERDSVQQHLRLTGLVAARLDGGEARLKVRNRIFARTFDAAWVEKQEGRRPFSEALARWLQNRRRDDFLLRGRALEAAQAWARERQDLTPEETAFLMRGLEVEELERQRQLKRFRRLAALLAFGVLITLLLSFFVVQQRNAANVQRSQAEQNAEMARMEQERAERNAETARQETARAEKERRAADEARRETEEKRREAESQQAIAEEQRRLAEIKEQEALAQKAAAEEAQRRADAERERAEQETERAESASRRAEASEAEARKLRMIDLGRALALQALRLPEDQAELSALLALQAHRLNTAHGGSAEESSIYSAVRTSLSRLDPHLFRVYRFAGDAVRSLAIAADGRFLAAGSDDDTVSLIDLASGSASAPAWSARIPSEVRSVALGSGWLAAGAFDGSIQVWKSPPSQLIEQRGEVAAEPRALEGHRESVNSLAFDGKGGRLASAGSDGRIGLWQLDGTSDPVAWLDAPGAVRTVAWSSGGVLAAATAGGLALWRQPAAGAAPEVVDREQDLRAVAFDAAGGLMAAGSRGGVIGLWDVEESPPAKRHELSGHRSAVVGLSFAAGDLLASASLDGTVRLWQADAPDAEPKILADHADYVRAVVLDPAGEQVISGSRDRSIRVWQTRTAALAGKVCPRVPRNLSLDEWESYLPGVEYQQTCPELPAGP